jgi:hypothetical protein
MPCFFDDFLTFVRDHHPDVYPILAVPPFGPNFVSPATVDVTAKDFQGMADAVRAIEAIRALPDYQASVLAGAPQFRLDPGNRSVLMGYDFFITPDGPRLIEINTNAAASLVVALLNDFHQMSPSFSEWESSLKTMFETEWQLAGLSRPLQTVAIVDEQPTTQRTAFEFHLFEMVFRQWGWQVVVADVADLVWTGRQLLAGPDGPTIDMVYNRFCDFSLATPPGKALRAAWEARTICLTPHPRDYLLLADKGRLVTLSDPEQLHRVGAADRDISAIGSVLPPVCRVAAPDADWFWAHRKTLFFKPATGFGSKGVYKGERISRKVFDTVLHNDYVAQPYFEAPSVPVDIDGQRHDFKYDVRLYVYRDKVLGAGARLFAGQAMNFQILGGGFAAVRVNEVSR